MFFLTFPLIIGEVMALEGLRRGQLGALMMACFIEISGDTRVDLTNLLATAQDINNVGWAIYNAVPDFLKPLATGFYDFLIGVN